MSETKICTKCGIEYANDNSNFYLQYGKTMSICKICIKKRTMKNYYDNHEEKKKKLIEYYYNNYDEVRESQNSYSKSEEGRLKRLEYSKTVKGKKSEWDRRYRENHKEELKLKISIKSKTEHNKKLHAIRNSRYKQTENGKVKSLFNTEKRRMLKLSLPYNFSVEDWNSCLEYFGNECAYCGELGKLTQDHFIPLSKGGEYTKNNIIPVCLSCNSSKQDRHFFSWYPSKPFYSKQREQKILKYLNYDKNNNQQLTLTI